MDVITGLPRSGSTLLTALLNQNPKFYASGTSVIPGLWRLAIVPHFSTSMDLRGEFMRWPEAIRERVLDVLAGTVTTYYEGEDGLRDKPGAERLFDKSRLWATNLLLLWKVFPKAKVIVTVRHPLCVFASVEKHGSLASPELVHYATAPAAIRGRADVLFDAKNANGIIGAGLAGVNDIFERNLDRKVLFVRAEALTASPEKNMRAVYDFLEEEYFEHDFESVEHEQRELDSLYLDQFPHEVGGTVKPLDVQGWRQIFNPDLAKAIMLNATVQAFCRYVGYDYDVKTGRAHLLNPSASGEGGAKRSSKKKPKTTPSWASRTRQTKSIRLPRAAAGEDHDGEEEMATDAALAAE